MGMSAGVVGPPPHGGALVNHVLRGEPRPPEFTRPEVSRVLIEGLRARNESWP